MSSSSHDARDVFEAAAMAAAALANGSNSASDGVHLAEFVVAAGARDVDVQTVQRDVRAASYGHGQSSASLVITPTMIDVCMSDAAIRDALTAQLPGGCVSYATLAWLVALFRAVDACMKHPGDASCLDRATQALQQNPTSTQPANPREHMAAMINSFILIEKQKPEDWPASYEPVATSLKRYATRLAAVDRGVAAYRQAVAEAQQQQPPTRPQL